MIEIKILNGVVIWRNDKPKKRKDTATEIIEEMNKYTFVSTPRGLGGYSRVVFDRAWETAQTQINTYNNINSF